MSDVLLASAEIIVVAVPVAQNRKLNKTAWNRLFILFPNVPSDLSLLAFGIPPAREAESAGGMPKVPKGQGLGRLVR